MFIVVVSGVCVYLGGEWGVCVYLGGEWCVCLSWW